MSEYSNLSTPTLIVSLSVFSTLPNHRIQSVWKDEKDEMKTRNTIQGPRSLLVLAYLICKSSEGAIFSLDFRTHSLFVNFSTPMSNEKVEYVRYL